jgi:hypothetical protein
MIAFDRSAQPISQRLKYCVKCGAFRGLGSDVLTVDGVCAVCVSKSTSPRPVFTPERAPQTAPGKGRENLEVTR